VNSKLFSASPRKMRTQAQGLTTGKAGAIAAEGDSPYSLMMDGGLIAACESVGCQALQRGVVSLIAGPSLFAENLVG
jgi:hypothetical protein